MALVSSLEEPADAHEHNFFASADSSVRPCSELMPSLHACDRSLQMPMSTKFEMRGDPGVVRNYGRMLVELAACVPDGLVS